MRHHNPKKSLFFNKIIGNKILYFLLLLIRFMVRSQAGAAIKSKNLKIGAALKMKKKKKRSLEKVFFC